MHQRLWLVFVISLVVASLFSCEKDPTAIKSPGRYQWPESTPAQQGMNDTILSYAYLQAEQTGFVNSLLIVRNGYLIGENYYRGFDADDAQDVMSVSKSFISTLIGLAFREGHLDSLGQKVLDFFPDYVVTGMDPRKRQITLRHLITMRAGFDNAIEDYGVNWNRWVSSDDWIQYTIQLPLLYDPGTRFAYITAETHLLSAILTKATGMSTLDFATKYLFRPLQINIAEWERDPTGYYIGGMRMHFIPRDMARFGYLYLHGGNLDGQQIIPAKWVKESLEYHTSLNGNWGELQNMGYGYQWWLGSIRNQECFMALGYAGQFIIVFPQLQLIVVTTSDYRYYKDDADQHERAILAICSNNILTAVVD
jgi:CubicO group peptidase (beta-lactamase class C family)